MNASGAAISHRPAADRGLSYFFRPMRVGKGVDWGSAPSILGSFQTSALK